MPHNFVSAICTSRRMAAAAALLVLGLLTAYGQGQKSQAYSLVN